MARPRVLEFPDGKIELNGFKTDRADELEKLIKEGKIPEPDKPIGSLESLSEVALSVTTNSDGKSVLVTLRYDLKSGKAAIESIKVGFNRTEIVNLYRRAAVDNDFV